MVTRATVTTTHTTNDWNFRTTQPATDTTRTTYARAQQVTDPRAWRAFTKAVVQAASVRWKLTGDASLTLRLASAPAWLGELAYSGIKLKVEGTSSGMGGFTTPFP